MKKLVFLAVLIFVSSQSVADMNYNKRLELCDAILNGGEIHISPNNFTVPKFDPKIVRKFQYREDGFGGVLGVLAGNRVDIGYLVKYAPIFGELFWDKTRDSEAYFGKQDSQESFIALHGPYLNGSFRNFAVNELMVPQILNAIETTGAWVPFTVGKNSLDINSLDLRRPESILFFQKFMEMYKGQRTLLLYKGQK